MIIKLSVCRELQKNNQQNSTFLTTNSMVNFVPMTLFRPKAVHVYVHDHDDDNEHVVVNVDVVVTAVQINRETVNLDGLSY